MKEWIIGQKELDAQYIQEAPNNLKAESAFTLRITWSVIYMKFTDTVTHFLLFQLARMARLGKTARLLRRGFKWNHSISAYCAFHG